VAPVFWIGLMAILLFAPGVGGPLAVPLFSEPGTYEPLTSDPVAWLRSLLVPWIVLGIPLAGLTARMMRSSMAEVLESEFLRTARAKGLSEPRVLRRHAFPAAAGPVATVVGIYGATTASNALLVEQVFGIPGILRGTLRAAAIGDFELLQGLVIVSTALVVLGTFVADVVAGWLDPRVRSAGSR
jgi:peptide/nickel transport system permease protein